MKQKCMSALIIQESPGFIRGEYQRRDFLLLPPQERPTIPFKPLITHNDLDGILSYLFLREKGYELAGLYDLNTLYMRETVAPHDCLAVDLDVSHPKIASLGHHLIVFGNENHMNANLMFGAVDKEGTFPYVRNGTPKSPIPTILLLYYLTNTPLPKNPLRRALLLYADGLHQSYNGYKKNVVQWLTVLGYAELVRELKDKQYEHEIQQIVEMVKKHGFKATKKKPYPQCVFSVERFSEQLPLINDLATIMGYKKLKSLPILKPLIKGERYSFFYDHETHNALQKKFDEWELFSHGITYLDQIEVTLLTPLKKGEDDLLISRLKNASWRQYLIA